ncbi:MAG: sulfite reductase subunit alpha [Verrucomicrobia bacterium]|nr:sulfite reductase subunit alpha [Verrucomicrobiota bacterium]NDD81925.1 sulfite reductase subunit alpha [Verrucomicrobiota bacterium]
MSETATAAKAPASSFNRNNPFSSRLRENSRLNKSGSSKDTRHIVIELGSAGPTYTCGDSLGVVPRNPDRLVDEFLQKLGLTGDASLREVLAATVILNRAGKKFVKAVADKASGPARDKLQAICADEKKLDEYVFDRDVVDVMNDAPGVKFDPAELPGLLNKIAPRLYSIASSPDHRPGEVHLTVAVVQYTTHGRPKQGLASGYLADLAAAAAVPVYVQPTRHFHLPAPDRDVIMVGPGTGIAPFRAFLQHRAKHGHTGRNWLFFGDQHAATDFLYGDEFAAAQKAGTLHKISTAFSRDQAEKIYVQHRMEQEGAELWRWLEKGAYFYVCGDAKRMAKDVHQALLAITAKHGGKNPEQAEEYVSVTLSKTEKRYLKDVY